jgi:sugar lactone lactonase YvrE
VLLSVFAVPAPASARQGAGALTLAAGGNGAGFAGDGGPATAAKLDGPHGAAVGPDGTLYIADTGNHRVRAVAPDGTIRTVAGDGTDTGETGSLPAGSNGTSVSLRRPTEVAAGADGAVYVADSGVGRIYAVDPGGVITVRAEVAGSRAGGDLRGLAVGADGTVFVSDRDHARVLAYSAAGAASVIAGDGAAPKSYTPVGAPGTLAVDRVGDLWIAGQYLYRVRAGDVAPVMLPGPDRWAIGDAGRWPPDGEALTGVNALGLSGADIFVVDNSARTVDRLSSGGVVSRVMELAVDPFGRLDPVEVVAGPAGRIYLLDTVGSRIFATEVPESVPQPEGAGAPLWAWLIGAGVLTVVAVAVAVVSRNRRSTRGL